MKDNTAQDYQKELFSHFELDYCAEKKRKREIALRIAAGEKVNLSPDGKIVRYDPRELPSKKEFFFSYGKTFLLMFLSSFFLFAFTSVNYIARPSDPNLQLDISSLDEGLVKSALERGNSGAGVGYLKELKTKKPYLPFILYFAGNCLVILFSALIAQIFILVSVYFERRGKSSFLDALKVKAVLEGLRETKVEYERDKLLAYLKDSYELEPRKPKPKTLKFFDGDEPEKQGFVYVPLTVARGGAYISLLLPLFFFIYRGIERVVLNGNIFDLFSFWNLIDPFILLYHYQSDFFHSYSLLFTPIAALCGLFYVSQHSKYFYDFVAEEIRKAGSELDKRHRGVTLAKETEVKELSQQLVKDEPSVLWSNQKVKESHATKHFAVVGKTGSGKTITIQLLMQSVLPTIAPGSNKRAVIYDPKRDFITKIKSMPLHKDTEIHILNPFDSRCVAWDIAKDINTPIEAETFASLLISTAEGQGDDGVFFDRNSRLVVARVIQAFQLTMPGEWTFRDVLVTLRDLDRTIAVLMSCDFTRQFVSSLFPLIRTSQSIMATIAGHLSHFEYLASAWEHAERKISLTEWIESESILLLANDETASTSLNTINRLFISRLTQLLLNQPENESRKTWVFLDELPVLGDIKKLTALMARARSKGGCVVLGFQDIEGLFAVYGEHRTGEIMGNVSHFSILKLAQQGTCDWASKMFGRRSFVWEGESVATTTSLEKKHGQRIDRHTLTETTTENLQETDVVLTSEFMSIPEPSPAVGLTGFHIFPELGHFKGTISGDTIDKTLIKPKEGELELEPQDTSKLLLKGWNSNDLGRLSFIKRDFLLMNFEQKLEAARKFAVVEGKENLKTFSFND